MINLRRSISRRLLLAGLAIAGAFSLSTASALEVCVSSPALLAATFAQATFTGQPFTIKIVAGTYVMTSDLNYAFAAPIIVEGGYTQNCASRVVDPANTIIDIGAGHTFYWRQDTGVPTAKIFVEGVTFRNASDGLTFYGGSPHPFSDDEGTVVLKQVRFTQIQSTLPGTIRPAVIVKAHINEIVLENVLVDHVGANGVCAVDVGSIGHASVSISHLTADLTGDDDFCLNDDGSTAVFSISNSVLWSSDGPSGLPIFFGSLNTQSSINLINDIYSGQFTLAVASVQNQINADPLWINPSANNYRLQNASPAVNSGTLIVPGGEPTIDIESHPRVVGGTPDRGAYESNVNNQTVLIVTNTLDSGPGSLRQAMIEANSNPSIPKSIKFNIRTVNQTPVCPAVIGLNSNLPAIDSPMTIDGYTQPASFANTSAGAFNANLCILVKPASGTLSTGFKVLGNASATASLTLRGIGIGGFSQPLILLGGQNHVIAGNQFGGNSHGAGLPGAGLSAINIGVNAGGSLIIGGLNAADRNVIGGAAISGVSIQSAVAATTTSCQITNNLIGIDTNGLSSLSNMFGIDASSSGCLIFGNNVAHNTSINIWLQGNQNIVQQNSVGFTVPASNGFDDATGILVQGSGNIIGARINEGSLNANVVRNNLDGGIVVKGDSAVANSINANVIYDNGFINFGTDIDLWPTGGASGPTPNDDTDFDSGPNNLQNFPVPKGLVYTGSGSFNRPATLTAQLSTLPGIYRYDVYFSNAINPFGKRGRAEFILTRGVVQVNGSGKLTFTSNILVPNQNAGGVISMTVTNSSGSTSEIGTAMLTDTIFSDGME